MINIADGKIDWAFRAVIELWAIDSADRSWSERTISENETA
jgi:hypothetical protein